MTFDVFPISPRPHLLTLQTLPDQISSVLSQERQRGRLDRMLKAGSPDWLNSTEEFRTKKTKRVHLKYSACALASNGTFFVLP